MLQAFDFPHVELRLVLTSCLCRMQIVDGLGEDGLLRYYGVCMLFHVGN